MVVLLNTVSGSNLQLSPNLLYSSDSIKIWHDPGHQWLYVEWTGPQQLYTIRQGGQKILQLFREKSCTKILNNNHAVMGPWLDACYYLADELLPQLNKLGLQFIAWVQSPSPYSQYSREQTLEATSLTIRDKINTFNSLPAAKEWLMAV